MVKMQQKFVFVMFFLLTIFSLGENRSRMKRKVVFRKNTKMFLRLNGIEPFLNPKYNTIFRQGFGFRANWPMPDSLEKIHKLYQRDVHNDLDVLTNKPGLEDFVCLLKYFSDMVSTINYDDKCNGGVLCNVSKIIKESRGDDVKYFKSFFHKFSNVNGICPEMHYVPAPDADV